MVLWDDAEEARCLAALGRVWHPAKGDGKAYGACALEHLLALNKAGCPEEKNWGNVVQFWCGCNPDKGENGCGGVPYPTNRSRVGG